MMDRPAVKKVGIFGGSFDPIHNGHIAIAQSAYQEFSLNEVWFIPAGHSPNKNEKHMTKAFMRAEMTELAIRNFSYFKMSAIELEASETSYTCLTMSKLKERFPDTEFYFIMGADSLDYFDKWYHPEIICSLAVILVAVRDELDHHAVTEKIRQIRTAFSAEIYPLSCGRLDISSSKIRSCFKNRESAEGLLPMQVIRYIREHRLYQDEDQGNRSQSRI